MDYIFWSAIHSHVGQHFLISYDIACQWCKNLMERYKELPTHLQFDFEFFLTYVIPKFHIAAHGSSCQCVFSLNFLRYMARFDGENLERGWAWLNLIALSTREMGPGARQDTLEDQWMAWNWHLVVKLGKLHLMFLMIYTNRTTIQVIVYTIVF